MKTGSKGTFVISWAQTEVDGLQAAPLDVLNVGATWRWTGNAVRVDAPQSVLVLEGAEGVIGVRKRAARMVRRLIGAAIAPPRSAISQNDVEQDDADHSFVVTDGRVSYLATLIPVPETTVHLIMFLGDVPPANSDLWVVRVSVGHVAPDVGRTSPGGVICFTPGTRIMTPDGTKRIEDLRPGDAIQTKDNGAQSVLWTGHRRMTGARLYAMPHLRPIRFRSGGLGIDRPDEDLLVSPQHRMLVKGAAALSLFHAHEVLVAAEDLINDTTICIDCSLREVTYVHVLMERHQIVWANGLETESFHPSNSALETVDPAQRAGLLNILPGLADDPFSYGDFARRNLTSSEAAILRHDHAA
jgi:Hint domain